MQTLKIEDVIDLAITNTASLFEETQLVLNLSISDNLPPVLGDRDKLLQAMINLISNAVKFTPKGGVTIQAQMSDHSIIVCVNDTGIGIAADDIPRVFEKFIQAGDSLISKPRGTGLGLPIVKEIIEHHGGKVWVESVPGIGSSFYFSIPVNLES
jgi:signal transduction histidine kinase